jgi:hypothetical protein
LAFLLRLWLSSLIVYLLFSVFSVTVAVTGWPLTLLLKAEAAYFFDILLALGGIALGLTLVSVFAGIAYEIRSRESTPPLFKHGVVDN